jgi:MFS transporter, putative metabolite:H+ symporter
MDENQRHNIKTQTLNEEEKHRNEFAFQNEAHSRDSHAPKSRSILTAVIVAALGYFVDVYDLVLFSIVRVKSLQDLQLNPEEVLVQGVHLMNMQMFGMLLGGVLWGIYGDTKGRLSVLFGSIFLYSAANLANSYVTSVDQYALLRFIAGVGLAGELGAGITLVSEIMSKEKRGLATTFIATVGVTGAVFAATVGELTTWRTAYLIGGILGIFLLVLRISVVESGMFKTMKSSSIRRGDLILLFSTKERVQRYITCIFVGLPIWFVIGVLITFSPELAVAAGIKEAVHAGTAVKYSYVGLIAGDLVSGLLSQFLKSRKKAIFYFLFLNLILTVTYLSFPNNSAATLYMLCLPLGFSVGYWAVFVTSAAEQFGTNLRATVATSVPNFVRGGTILLTNLFLFLKTPLGMIESGYIVGCSTILLSIVSLHHLKESFHYDLNYIEE